MKLKSLHNKKWSLNWKDYPQSGRKYISDKGLVNRIYRELKKLNSSQIYEPIKEWATELNRTF
jgi:hypothetical protein